MVRKFIVLTSIVLLALIAAACQPGANEADEGPPVTGNQSGETQPAAGEPDANGCENIDAETLAQTGNNVYSTRCASCHGAQGEGSGTFPGIANVESLNAADITMTLQTFFNPEIHPFVDDITNDDVAAVLSYVRGSFGNDAPVICPEQVEAFRPGP